MSFHLDAELFCDVKMGYCDRCIVSQLERDKLPLDQGINLIQGGKVDPKFVLVISNGMALCRVCIFSLFNSLETPKTELLPGDRYWAGPYAGPPRPGGQTFD